MGVEGRTGEDRRERGLRGEDRRERGVGERW